MTVLIPDAYELNPSPVKVKIAVVAVLGVVVVAYGVGRWGGRETKNALEELRKNVKSMP